MIRYISFPKIRKFLQNPNYFDSYLHWFLKVSIFRIFKLRITRKKYFRRHILSGEKSSILLDEVFNDSKPFFAGRLGNAELIILSEIEAFNTGLIDEISVKSHSLLTETTGFFFSNKINRFNELKEFYELYINSLNQLDLLFTFDFGMEPYFANKYLSSKSIIAESSGLEPYLFDINWGKSLINKKILIVHPFKNSIEYQINSNKYNRLFKNGFNIPKNNIILYKTYQTIGGNNTSFDSWTQILEKMYSDISSIDYDIVFISAGSYGLPLGFKLFQDNKVVIHVGGALQNYFGIKGSRWKSNKLFSSIINEHWIEPLKEDYPSNFNDVSYKAYW